MMVNHQILIVEDDASWRDEITNLLSSSGYDVIEASSIKGAYSLIDKIGQGLTIDAVILDLALSKTSGVDGGLSVLSHLREQHPDIPCIVFTGHDLPMSRADSLFRIYHVFAGLEKSRDMPRLVEVIHKALTNRAIEGSMTLDYERGLDALKAQLEQTNRYVEFTTLEARLRENLRGEHLYGTDETSRSERARIINSLNQLALEVLGLSFNDLALGRISPARQTSARELSLVRQLNVTPSPFGIKPPVLTHLQDLPFNELSWEQFEALCSALIEAQSVTISCHLYGVQGDSQQGIDIVATQRGAQGDEAWAYQCKRYKEYTPARLREAVAKMVYPADYYVIILSVPATTSLRQVADEHPNLFIWDSKDIARKLKNYPGIVEDFFGSAWREAFCAIK
jgi:CheY-like chemotaxis protein